MPTYKAQVYSRTVSYENYKGEKREVELSFALDPIQLMQTIAKMTNARPKKKSGNPAAKDQGLDIAGEEALKFIREVSFQAAGYVSDDGEEWIPYESFADSIAGKAFITQLAASDGDRREFAQKVILDPFKSFVAFAVADESNSPEEVETFKTMAEQMENIFAPVNKNETPEDRKKRLLAELDTLDKS